MKRPEECLGRFSRSWHKELYVNPIDAVGLAGRPGLLGESSGGSRRIGVARLNVSLQARDLMADSASPAPRLVPVERVFILRSRLGTNIYVIRGDTLHVTWRLFGKRGEEAFPIRRISANYEIRGSRNLRLVSLLLVPAGLCVAVYRVLSRYPDLPDFLLQFVAYVGAIFAIAAIRWYPRFEWFVFKNDFGRPLFTILREPAQRDECEDFVHALLDRIEGHLCERPTDEPTGVESRPASVSGAFAKWKVAIAFSIFSILTPPVCYLCGGRSYAIVLLPGMIGAGGSIVAAIVSNLEKEPGRYWAIAAGVASLIPVFIY